MDRFLLLLLLSLFIHESNGYLHAALLTHSSYKSVHLAFKQSSQILLNQSEVFIDCDVAVGIKELFDLINRTSTNQVIVTDACQTVLSSLAETTTYFQLPVFSFTDSDLSLSAKDRYPLFYQIVPSDHAQNLVRKELLRHFNWTRFGLIYQHGSKYTLVANDFSQLIETDRKHWQINITRGIPYRHGSTSDDENISYIKNLFRDLKAKDIRIILANFNQTIARHLFCQAAEEKIYGSRYQWIMLGYPSFEAWWNQPMNCSRQDFIRAINGTLQTRVPHRSMDPNLMENRSNFIDDFLNQTDEQYFYAYAYDTIWTLTYLNENPQLDQIDFIGATGRVRFLQGNRIGEVLVEQYVACRMMNDGSCQIPCYKEDEHCNLTVVKIFLAKHGENKVDPPKFYQLNDIMWHGHGSPSDRTTQRIVFEHVSLPVFIIISAISAVGLLISCSLFAFNLHYRSHRYIRMSSPSLNNLILAGCMLAYLSTIFAGINSSLPLLEEMMNVICPARLWLLSLSFTLAFGSMFSKTWRVHSIFTNINMNKRGIHDFKLLLMVALLLGIDLVFLIAWQLFDPIHRQIIHIASYRLPSNADIEICPYREECSSRYMSLWFVVLILYKGLLMFYGSFLAWTTRHVTVPALNDSRYIGLSVYIVFICCTLGSLVTFIPSEQIQLGYVLSSIFILLCTTATVALVFVPKVVEVYHDPNARKRHPRMTGRFKSRNQHRSAMITQKHLNNALIDNQQLHLVLTMQEQTLNRLIEEYEKTSENPSPMEPFEFERLIVTENVDDDDDDDDEQRHGLSIPPNNQVLQGRLARAVSLCLFNKLHVGPFYWPDSLGMIRKSTSNLPAMTYSTSMETSDEQHEGLLDDQIEFDLIYEGLLNLNEDFLNELIETDLNQE